MHRASQYQLYSIGGVERRRRYLGLENVLLRHAPDSVFDVLSIWCFDILNVLLHYPWSQLLFLPTHTTDKL